MVTDQEILGRLQKEIGKKLRHGQHYRTDKTKNVTALYLRGLDLVQLPKSLFELTNLRELSLYDNKLRALSPDIRKLKNLEHLTLHANELTELPAEIGELERLKILNLFGNQLAKLPQEILRLGIKFTFDTRVRGDGIYLGGESRLESPPIEIVRKGRGAVEQYFKSLEGKKQALNEVKVLLVGDGSAGKTSLVKRLLELGFDEHEPQTHGINIRDWRVRENNKSISIHFWDFGGQEIMHATHQFFLSKRSLYILVLDGRKDEDAEYWLKHIESFGGDSPVLVALNKTDQNPGFDVNRRFLQDKYGGIKGFYRVSCASKMGITDFSRDLRKELANVKILETTWAKSWFNVKTKLEKMTENFICYDEYKAMCSKENILDEAAQDTLVDFLNDLGVILHFKDFRLLDTHVLEPKWVTEAVYRIINSEELAEAKGVLELTLLDQILRKKRRFDFRYPADRYPYIIELMKKFELCYEIDDQTVLVPDLLEVQEPEIEFDYEKPLRFLIEYDFLPKSIMPRFIVKMHKDIKGQSRWRTGVVLEDKSFHSTAVIKADERDKKIYIYVNGAQKRDYFSVIRYAFQSINSSFEKLEAIEKVPMPDAAAVTVSYEHLIRLERKAVEEYIPDGSEKAYKVKDLLGTIYVEKKTEKEILQLLKKLKEESDSPETLLKKAEDIIQLQPNLFGMGIDLKKLIKRLFGKKR